MPDERVLPEVLRQLGDVTLAAATEDRRHVISEDRRALGALCGTEESLAGSPEPRVAVSNRSRARRDAA